MYISDMVHPLARTVHKMYLYPIVSLCLGINGWCTYLDTVTSMTTTCQLVKINSLAFITPLREGVSNDQECNLGMKTIG